MRCLLLKSDSIYESSERRKNLLHEETEENKNIPREVNEEK